MTRIKTFDIENVLDKAMDLFWIKGYNATSMQDLVDHLDISRSSLYESFGDKKDLYKSVLVRYRDTNTQRMIDMLTNTNSIYNTLEEILEGILKESISDKKHHGCFMINATIEFGNSDVEISSIIAENNDLAETAITESLKKGQESGQINKNQSPRSLARFFMNAVAGLRVSARKDENKKKYQDAIQVILSVFKP